MAWIESHEEIGDHKKTHRLSAQLGCSIPTAVGLVHLLWHYTLKVAWKDGDLSEFTPPVIARACWFDGDPFLLIEALKESEFIDKNMFVHEWKEYAKHIIYQRKYNHIKRKNQVKNLQNSCKNPVVTPKKAPLPNLTIPNLTKQTTKTYDERFASFWEAYPKKIGKGAAEKAWEKIGDLAAVYEKILWAVGVQKLSDQWKKDNGQFIPNPATWLHQRRWEDEIEQPRSPNDKIYEEIKRKEQMKNA